MGGSLIVDWVVIDEASHVSYRVCFALGSFDFSAEGNVDEERVEGISTGFSIEVQLYLVIVLLLSGVPDVVVMCDDMVLFLFTVISSLFLEFPRGR